MRPRERRDSGQRDLLHSRLDQIVDLHHPLSKLAATIDWRFLEDQLGASYSEHARTTAAADAADGRPRHHQAHAQPFR